MLDDLSLFIRIVQSGSLAAAAQRLGIPAATLTRRLQKLEQRLGCRLLHRSARRLLPTNEGWQYYERCRPLLESLQQATESLDVALNQVAGNIRVLAPLNLANGLFRAAWSGFLQRYPETRLELRLSNDTEDLLGLGGDLALRVGPQQDSEFNQRRLGMVATLLVAAPSYIAQHPKVEHPEQLLGHALVLAEPLNRWSLQHSQTGEHWHLPAIEAPRLRVNELQLAVDMAVAGLGILHVPHYLAQTALADGRLMVVLPNWRGIIRPVWAIWPQQRALPARVRALLEYLVEYAAQQPSLQGELS